MVERFTPSLMGTKEDYADCVLDEDGDFVRYSVFTSLQSDNERLTKALEASRRRQGTVDLPDEDADLIFGEIHTIDAPTYVAEPVTGRFIREIETRKVCGFQWSPQALASRVSAGKVKEPVINADAMIAALVSLANSNIAPDIQELLVNGDPMRSIAPSALYKAIAAALSCLSPAPEAVGGEIERFDAFVGSPGTELEFAL